MPWGLALPFAGWAGPLMFYLAIAFATGWIARGIKERR